MLQIDGLVQVANLLLLHQPLNERAFLLFVLRFVEIDPDSDEKEILAKQLDCDLLPRRFVHVVRRKHDIVSRCHDV